MIINCDNIDMSIINGLIKGYTYEKISEINSMAVSSIKYRIKKMEYNLNVTNREEFIISLKEYDLNL
jgi:DNA-binding CsgD family transcriptional regulator